MSSWVTSEWGLELRELWNEFDPIGVFPVDTSIVVNPVDEYDGYHGLIIKHLNQSSPSQVIFKDIQKLVTEKFGMSWNDEMAISTNKFIEDVMSWFEIKKPELKK